MCLQIQIFVVTIIRVKKPYLFLLLILILALFFRTYQLVERMDFGHDADLFSWIVKDILINGHQRLIGQEISAPGIFFGSLFYYLLVPFYLIFNMDPVAAIFPITAIGMLTVLSYYFVFSRLFNVGVGLIAAFLYAVLISTSVWFDRRLAPSTPTNLWTIWYFFTVIMLSRGKFGVLPLLGILIGLIWHIHIALVPALVAIPSAFWVSGKLPNFSQSKIFVITLFVSSLPLIIFELKHNFQQTINLLQNFTIQREGAEGLYKLQIVAEMISKNINNLFFAPQSLKITNNVLFPLLILVSAFWLIKRRLISSREIISLYAWILGVIIFFSVSSSPISEYYFYNIEVIFLGLFSLLLYSLFTYSFFAKLLCLGLLALIASKNAFFLITQDYYHKGYLEKKAVVDYIVNGAKIRNFPCFSINYITSPGENVGFRYFFFLKNAHIAVPGRGSPVYSIVIPDEYALKEVKIKFGHIGVIPPTEIASKEITQEACSGQNTNLTDPMFGYVK